MQEVSNLPLIVGSAIRSDQVVQSFLSTASEERDYSAFWDIRFLPISSLNFCLTSSPSIFILPWTAVKSGLSVTSQCALGAAV